MISQVIGTIECQSFKYFGVDWHHAVSLLLAFCIACLFRELRVADVMQSVDQQVNIGCVPTILSPGFWMNSVLNLLI